MRLNKIRFMRHYLIITLDIINVLSLQLVSAEGSNVSDGASQCTDTVPHQEPKHDRVDHVTPGHTNRPPLPLSHDDTLTETESIISSRQGHHLHKTTRHHTEKYEKYNKYNGKLVIKLEPF